MIKIEQKTLIKTEKSNQKLIFKTCIEKHIKREGINELMEFIDSSDFYEAPASTRYHGSEPEGLIKHSLQVFRNLMKINKLYCLNYNSETLAIVGLFHDLCKVNMYVIEMRNRKVNGKWEQYPSYQVDEKEPLGHGSKSVIILQRYLKLSDEELQAIRWHMGGFVSQQEWSQLSNAMGKYPLVIYTQEADLEATFIDKM